MTSKYPVWACALALIGAACTASAPALSPSPAPPAAASTAAQSARGSQSPTAPSDPVKVSGLHTRAWYTVPDGLFREPAAVTVDFDGDVSALAPRIRLEPGARDLALVPTAAPTSWTAQIDLTRLPVGVYAAAVVERVAGADVVLREPTWEIRVSQPEYVVWTLDFEGDAASDEAMANTAAIADSLKVPMTILWNPRVWTTGSVTAPRADAMLAWTKGRGAKGDEIGMHIHMWTDFVSPVVDRPKVAPSWAGRGDGYDVPITAYSEEQQRLLIAFGLRLMGDHGIGNVSSFRAGGDFGDAATLRALVDNGFTADCTAVPAGTFGSLRWPWTLAPDAQPYRPSRDDANKPGDLPLVEAPTNGGNTFGYTVASIAPIVRADLAILAKAGEVAKERRAITIVSHPGTIDATERAAIETLLRAFDPLRYDRNNGPLRFVTLQQLAKAWRN